MNLPCLGIDIAKVKFNVCLLQSNGKLKHKVFPNNVAGFAQLHEWLEKQSVHRLTFAQTYLEAIQPCASAARPRKLPKKPHTGESAASAC